MKATTTSDNPKKLIPLHHLVLLRPEPDRKQIGSIILPDNHGEDSPRFGEVLAVGPGRVHKDGTRVVMQVKQGERVMYGRHAGTEVQLDGYEDDKGNPEKLRLVNQDEIMCVVE